MNESKPGSSAGMFFVASRTGASSSSSLGILVGIWLALVFLTGVLLADLLAENCGDWLCAEVRFTGVVNGCALAPSSGLEIVSPCRVVRPVPAGGAAGGAAWDVAMHLHMSETAAGHARRSSAQSIVIKSR